ncbi:MAG: hypothetical protein M3O99_04470 [Chloroflexota bacterium]|nr:hypothetical protein [Chloroflexota bacterium]
MRTAFTALICAIAIGAFVADFWFLDFFGAQGIVLATLPFLSFAIVGSFLVVRRAGGPIGWLLGAAGAILQIVLLSQAYGSASLEAGATLPGGEVALWSGSVIQFAAFGFLISALVRFPDGRPPGRAFAILLWAFVAFVVAAGVAVAFAALPIPAPPTYAGPHADDLSRSIPNPFALHGPVGDLMLLAAFVLKLVTPLVLIAPLALVVRFRRSSGVERQQLKWLTYTAAIAFGLSLIAYVAPPGPIRDVADATSILGIGLLPIAIGIAVTRYRLYDIDVLIRRTLIYAAVSAVLLATYVGGVAVLQTILAPLTTGSGVAVAISTLAVVALFQPLRTRIQSAVDHRFYRAKYHAERTLDRFAGRLRDEVELDSVRAELLNAVGETLQPSHASVWLRKVAP